MNSYVTLILSAGHCILLFNGIAAQITDSGSRSGVEARSGYEISERGVDFAVYRKVTESVTSDGSVIQKTNQFTLLENGIHYLDGGEWRESEDLVESFIGGAIARRGPNKAIFSHELNADIVFDIETQDGRRVRGGVRAIQLFNLETGQAALFGRVKDSVRAQLQPPNQIFWLDAFDGVEADVVLVWRFLLGTSL